MYEYLLFDLDGTLTDSAPGIINSIEYALKKRNIIVEDREALYSFVGPPLIDSFRINYGFSHDEGLACVMDFREYFGSRGMYENMLYPNVGETLKKLKETGRRLILATSKPEIFAVKILEHFDIRKYFDHVAGASQDEKRNTKPAVIHYALGKAGIDADSEKETLKKVIMIGDREHDILGAKEFGLDSLGVLYGYGSLEELERAGATYLAETPGEMADIIINRI